MPYLFKALKKVLVQSVIAHCTVIPLDIAVLLRLAGLDVRQAETFSPGPALQASTDIFWAVIATDFFGAASPFVKQCAAHAVFTTKFRDGETVLSLLQSRHDLAVGKPGWSHAKSPWLVILGNSTYKRYFFLGGLPTSNKVFYSAHDSKAEGTARLYAEKKWGKRVSLEKGCILFHPEHEQDRQQPEISRKRQGLSR